MEVRPTLVLVHSPLVGPYSWRPAGDSLQSAGWRVVIPSLTTTEDGILPYWQRHASEVRAALDDNAIDDSIVLAGHSGAGPLLPAIARGCGRHLAAYVFVDSDLPAGGKSRLDQFVAKEHVDALRAMSIDGMLPPWNQWFAEEAMAELIPDEASRARFLAELRPTPLAVYEEKLPAVEGWPDAPCAYIQLSGAYDAPAAAARARDWLFDELDSTHLGLVTDADAVARSLARLAVAALAKT